MLKVTTKTHGDVVQIDLDGAIDGSDSCRKIHDVIRTQMQAGRPNFVFNLSGVDWVNSLGVGFLVAAAVSAARQDAVVRLFGLTPRVDQVLRACGVVPHVWQGFESEEEALASFE